MSASVETLEGLERRLTLNLPLAEIETEVTRRLQKLARNVKLDGFRPGKAPLKVVAGRYGAEVRGEVISDALQTRFMSVVQESKIDVAGYPRFVAIEPASADQASFSATFEVLPEIVIGDVAQIKVTRPLVDVTEADVDRTLDVLRKQRVQYHAVERVAANGDRVHVDYRGTVDGQPFPGGEARDFPVLLGEGRTLKDFEGALVGLRPGESKTFEVAFPEDYFAKELAGKTATFEATVKSVHEPHLPEVDDAFSASMGVREGGPARLREEIAGNLQREAKRRIGARVKEQVMQGLLDVTPFDVPQGLVRMEQRTLLERAFSDLKARGMKEQDIRLDESVFEPQARRRVALSLLLNALAAQHAIRAEADQVRAMVDEFAQSYEDPAEVAAWYYQDASRLRDVQALVLEENIVAWVLQRAQVSDESTTLENLMGKA